jgi:hypothetical protein
MGRGLPEHLRRELGGDRGILDQQDLVIREIHGSFCAREDVKAKCQLGTSPPGL